jgi:hypothetical protein
MPGLQRFSLGRILATPGALETLNPMQINQLLFRHHSGDWSEMDPEDQAANERALDEGSRIFSAFQVADNVRIWIITEADRSSTCVLLPDEY